VHLLIYFCAVVPGLSYKRRVVRGGWAVSTLRVWDRRHAGAVSCTAPSRARQSSVCRLSLHDSRRLAPAHCQPCSRPPACGLYNVGWWRWRCTVIAGSWTFYHWTNWQGTPAPGPWKCSAVVHCLGVCLQWLPSHIHSLPVLPWNLTCSGVFRILWRGRVSTEGTRFEAPELPWKHSWLKIGILCSNFFMFRQEDIAKCPPCMPLHAWCKQHQTMMIVMMNSDSW